uniref:Uncharacterized protein n=1 Tax=Amphimedon queenslandica TaxID=400682 RepID=A0A1X7T736_AMPQE
MRRCNLTKVFHKNKESKAWRELEVFLTDYNPDFDSKQLLMCRHSKCFQTVFRLGTYTAKVLIYNSLKACKGTVFYLPLPLEKTMKTLGEAKDFRSKNLPDPEL